MIAVGLAHRHTDGLWSSQLALEGYSDPMHKRSAEAVMMVTWPQGFSESQGRVT